MSRPDKKINILLWAIFLIYLAVLMLAVCSNQTRNWVSFLNAVSSLSILIYWLQKQFRIKQHFYEKRENIVLVLEITFAALEFFSTFGTTVKSWLQIVQYLIFGIHFIVLLIFLIFMLTFKLKKLI